MSKISTYNPAARENTVEKRKKRRLLKSFGESRPFFKKGVLAAGGTKSTVLAARGANMKLRTK